MSSTVRSVGIAKQRLAEKEAEVKEQLEFVAGLVRRLKTDKSILVTSFENQYDNLHDQFAVVHGALVLKEENLLHQLKNDLQCISTANDELTASAENMVNKSRHALEKVKDMYEKTGDAEFIANFSSTIQQLEEVFINLVLLLDEHTQIPIKRNVHLNHVLQSIEDVCFIGEEIHSTDPRVTSQCSVSVPNRKPGRIGLACGEHLEVVVTNVLDPENICVQPYSNDLVELMNKLGMYYEDLASFGECGGLEKAPHVGDFCCAKFTQDDCWYRAVVSAVDPIYTREGTPNVCVKVQYIDYGNQEQVPLNRLRVLEQSFYDLPCQALTCFLAGVTPASHSRRGRCNTDEQQDEVPLHINQWLQQLLLGNKVEMCVLTGDDHDQYGIDILIEKEVLLSAEWHASFPVSVHAILQLPELEQQGSLIRLSSFLCCVGIAETVPICRSVAMSSCLETTEAATKAEYLLSPCAVDTDKHVCCIPEEYANILPNDHSHKTENFLSHKGLVLDFNSTKEDIVAGSEVACDHKKAEGVLKSSVGLQNLINLPAEGELSADHNNTKEDITDKELASDQHYVKQPVHPNSTRVLADMEVLVPFEILDFEEPSNVLITSKLKPLSVKLGAMSDVGVLVSHVVSSKEFYVHPIQEDVALSVAHLSESLTNHMSFKANQRCFKHSASISNDVDRVLCCVQCPEDKQWYRAVILSSPQDSVSCSVHLLDFGECISVPFDCLCELDETFYCYPAQAVCCSVSFDGHLYPDSESDERICIYLKESVAKKQLVACVKGSKNYSTLAVEYGTVLTVDIVDTNGEKDIDVRHDLPQVCKNELAGHRKLSTWNPMERDYLALRNNYNIDDEDVGLTLSGYKSRNRPCRFFHTRRGCDMGDNCPYLHLQEGVSDKQLEEAFTATDQINIPVVDSVVGVVVTAIVSPTRFFVQMPKGSKSVLSKSIEEKDDTGSCFMKLLKEMRIYYNQHVFSERSVTLPDLGEIVAVPYDCDEHWYRARVVDPSSSGKTKVFYVDYGHFGLVCDEDVRSIKPSFLVVPFQAIECYLVGLDIPATANHVNRKEAKEYFEHLVSGQVLMAKVVIRLGDVLGLELYSNVHINEKLAKQGILKKTCTTVLNCEDQDTNVEQLLTPG